MGKTKDPILHGVDLQVSTYSSMATPKMTLNDFMSTKKLAIESTILSDDYLKAIINLAPVLNTGISIVAKELLSLRQQVKDWRECADKLAKAIEDLLDDGSDKPTWYESSYEEYQDLLKKYPEVKK
jgi:hypothetical protein